MQIGYSTSIQKYDGVYEGCKVQVHTLFTDRVMASFVMVISLPLIPDD